MELDIDFSSGPAGHRYFLLDVFTDTPLAGNQLAVFTDGAAFDAPTMQRIARELALPETVFLFTPERGGEARARIFTPQLELPFAGHPTLGSAWLIASSRGLDQLRLEMAGGIMPVTFERAGDALRFGWMEQPLPTIESYAGDQAELLGALGATRSLLPIETYTNGPVHVLVMLESAEAVAALEPDFGHSAASASAALPRAPAASRRVCSRPRSGSARTPRPARPPGRSHCTSRVTARSPSAPRSRSARASRSDARRCCARASTDRRRPSSALRSAAPR
jgi:predicted PhzF superfamily epimerase YddE/YHI9